MCTRNVYTSVSIQPFFMRIFRGRGERQYRPSPQHPITHMTPTSVKMEFPQHQCPSYTAAIEISSGGDLALTGVTDHAIFGHLVAEGGSGNAEKLGGLGLIAGGPAKGVVDERAFDSGDGFG